MTGFVIRCAIFQSPHTAGCRGRPAPRSWAARSLRENRAGCARADRRAAPTLYLAGLSRLSKPVHVRQRIALPAHAADLLVEMRIAVGADIEARVPGRADRTTPRLRTVRDSGTSTIAFEEAARTHCRRVPGRPRQRTDDRRWQIRRWTTLEHCFPRECLTSFNASPSRAPSPIA